MPGTQIAYLGPEGTFAHLVATQRYRAGKLVPLTSISDVFDYVASKPNRHGIVPIANSSGGTIDDTVDCLIDSDGTVSVQEELSIRVKLALLGRKGTKVTSLYSHFAPFHHCDEWLKKNLPGVKRNEVMSTATAAKLAANEPGAAALCTKQAAGIYGLDVLQFPVVQNIRNVTQFFGLGQGLSKSTKRSKSSLVVYLPDEPGSLCDFLGPFKNAKINLSRIVSRPVAGHPNRYTFFVEIDADANSKGVQAALKAVRANSINVRVAGSYPVLPVFNS